MSFSRNLFVKEAKELGHSKEFIEEALSYAQKLTDLNMPVIFSPKHLRLILGVSFEFYKKITDSNELMYKSYSIKKRNGGLRQINSPFVTLKNIQKFLNSTILSKAIIHERAYAYQKNKNILLNAKIHANKKYLLKIDLLNFFDTITDKHVFRVFCKLGYHTNLAFDLAKITTTNLNPAYIESIADDRVLDIVKSNRVLPQGAPTSPAISNIILKNLDIRLFNVSKIHDVEYTRYADDLIFSSENIKEKFIDKIKEIIINEGFFINEAKTIISKNGQKQYVTGLSVTNGVHIPKSSKKEIMRHLHLLNKYGYLNYTQYLENQHNISTGNFKDWLWGKICFVNSVEPTVASKMIIKFNTINWPY